MSVKRIRYGFIVLSMCMFINLHADEITVRQIPVAKELPSNTVYRMFQDKDGFVWFGTPNGFCRYDGYRMKSFRSEVANPAFPSNYITGGFAEDTLNQTLWIGTEKGVLILDKRTHELTSLDTVLLEDSPIRQILYADNAVWVCSDFGLYLYNTDKSLRKKYLKGTTGIHIDKQGTVRTTTWKNGMYYLDKSADTFLPYPPIGLNNNPHKIFQDNADNFWISTWGDGLYRFYPDRLEQNMYERIDIPVGNLSFDIFFGIEQDDTNNYLWALSYAGLIVFKPNGNHIIPITKFSLPINNLTNIFSDIIKDRDGNIWLGTYEQGAVVINPSRSSVTNLDLQAIKTQTGYVPNIVKVFEDKEGELWMRQNRLGIFLLNPETSAIRQLNIPDITEANAICNNSYTGEIWVAVDYVPYIYRLRKSNGKISLIGKMDMRTVWGENAQIVKFLHEDKNGVIWAMTNNGLFSYEHDKWQVIKENCGSITGITEDSYGAIWISTAENGLFRIIQSVGKININNYNTNTCRIAGNNISCISAGNDGLLWLCVNEKQLFSYNISNQQFTDYTQKANVNNFVIFNIIADNNGRIWISSDKQVVEFNPLTGASIQYEAWNDLIVTSLHKNSILETHNGSIIYGGNKGICIFTPSPQLDMPCKKLKTMITDVKINGKSIYQRDINRKNLDWKKKLVLFPDETNLEIDFSSFNYPNPNKTRYAYKLEGVDKQWIYTESGRSFAVYNHLRKGEYTFFVKSTGGNQLWSKEITRLIIIRKPAFYETAWAYAGYTVIILLILFAGLRFYIGRIKLLTRIEMLIEQQEKRRKLFQKNIEITPSSIAANSLDEELVKKALLIVEKNMDNSKYSVDELASELAISRRQLSRRFHSIIGLSPGGFIRSIRLKRAAQLLKNTQYNISEISDRVGFSTIKYFNMNFKEEFGVTPTQYRSESIE